MKDSAKITRLLSLEAMELLKHSNSLTDPLKIVTCMATQ